MDKGEDRTAPADAKVEGGGNLSWPDTFAPPGTALAAATEDGDDLGGGNREFTPRNLGCRLGLDGCRCALHRYVDPGDGEGARREQENGVSVAAAREGIARVCNNLRDFLLEKNASYGNSAFEPINILSKLSAREGILIRIDDKLKRIRNGTAYPGDDNLKDLAGYLILLLTLDDLERK